RKMKVLEHLVFLAEIKGVDAKEAARRGRMWMEKLEISGWENKTVESLSKGMQQKIQFISTVIHDPQLIILDEPFTGLDPINTQLLKDIIAEMQQEGRTIVLSTHLMDQVEKLCSKICLINKGHKVLDGNLIDIKMEYGKNVVTMLFEGDSSAIKSFPGVEKVTAYGQELTITVREGLDTNELLKFAADHGRVERFEVGEISLHDIFISKVRGEGGEADEKAV
ncbi:ABC transporter, partial [bacterium]